MLLCSHRPVDVHNIYNQVQVKMLMKEDDCENIPAFEDVFRDEDDEEEQEEVGFAGGFVKSVVGLHYVHITVRLPVVCNFNYRVVLGAVVE